MDRREFLKHCALAAAGMSIPRSASALRIGRRDFEPEARARLLSRVRAAGCLLPLRTPAVRVEKGRRELILSDGRAEIVRFPVALGLSPTGHKQYAGDHRTPEGRYFTCTRNDASQYHLFMGLSYPSAWDARAGRSKLDLDDELIRAVERAERERRTPPWKTKLGGAVGIHGGGAGEDWTWGCVALDNEAIEELWIACPLGTPVEIMP